VEVAAVLGALAPLRATWEVLEEEPLDMAVAVAVVLAVLVKIIQGLEEVLLQVLEILLQEL
jgi:hypothetical protein